MAVKVMPSVLALLVLLTAVPCYAQEPAPLATDAVMLTRPDNTPIWVNPHAIAFIRAPLPGESGHTTIVFTSGAKQSVRESVDEIKSIVGAKVKVEPN